MSSCKILSMLGDAFTPDDRGVAWRARWLAWWLSERSTLAWPLKVTVAMAGNGRQLRLVRPRLLTRFAMKN